MKAKEGKQPFSAPMRHDTSNMPKGKSSRNMNVKGGSKKSGRGK